MARKRVSVCAVTSTDDVRACIEGGSDAVGVLVGIRHRADDAVTFEVGRELLESVPPYVGRYAITHLTDLDDLLDLANGLPIDSLQVHDAADPAVLAALRDKRPELRLLKGIAVTETVPDWQLYASVADALVLDTIDLASDRIGGTGIIHDWAISAVIVQACPIPVVLAGGLTPENVGAAVAQVQPWAVNVNSGVERDGRKDPRRVRAFVDAANGCSPSSNG